MQKVKLYLVFLLLFITVGASAQIKDTLYLFNQTMLIGELQKVKLGKIQFDGDGVGMVNIKYDKIKTMNARKHTFRIETTSRQLLYGVIEASGEDGIIIIKTEKESVKFKLADIFSLSFFGFDLKTKLYGQVGAGFSYTKSSDIGRFNLNGLIRYTNHKLESSLDGNMIITSDSTKTYRERENLHFNMNYLISTTWFTGATLSYQRNIELGLASRWQQGIGVGYRFLTARQSQGSAVTAIVINEEKNLSGDRKKNWEWMLQAKYTFFSFSKPNITLSANEIAYFSLSQKGRTRIDGDINLSWELFTDFSFNLNFYHNYDSKSPATQTARIDFGYVAGVNYKF